MSLNVFLTNISVIHLALLKRAMRFPVLSANDILARTLSVATSIVLGVMGWGYWALVAGTIVLPLSIAIGAWTLCRWLPGRPRRVEGTGSMVRFAMNTYWHYVVSYSARNMDNLLVGWRFGALSLGFYKKAYDMFALSASQLLSPVAPVGVAALSRVANDPVVYKRHFLRALSILALIGMGVSADVTLIGKDLIRVLLGPGWGEAGRIFTYFGPGIGIMLIYGTHGWMHLSLGKPDRWFRWGIIELVVTGLMFVLALPLGPAGIAIAWTASYWVLTVPAFWYAGQPVDFRVGSVLGTVWKYFVAALVAGCACAALLWRPLLAVVAPSAFFAATRAAMVSAVFVVLYLGAIVVLHGGIAPLRQMWELLPDLLPWKRLRTSTPAIASSERLEHVVVTNR
jgi:PST family polysaccharide transporter